jgi:hypothetical protein
MLLDEMKKRGLRVLNDAALPSVWRAAGGSQPLDAADGFTSLFQKRSLVPYVLGLSDFDIPEHIVAEELVQLSEQTVSDALREIAGRYNHQAINEVHLFLTLLELSPQSFERWFAWLQDQHRGRFPKGTARRQEVLRVAKQAGNQWLARKVLESIQETPYVRSKIAEKLRTYLSSAYYPFGPDEWRRYQLDGSKPRPRNHRGYHAEGFAAHRLRDEFLSNCLPPR